MRTARKNRKIMYYALFTEEVRQYDENGDECEDPIGAYSIPVKFSGVISPNKGSVYHRHFGQELNYDREILVTENLPIKEGSLIWLETAPPATASDGRTADYKVAEIARGLNTTVYAVDKVLKDGA